MQEMTLQRDKKKERNKFQESGQSRWCHLDACLKPLRIVDLEKDRPEEASSSF